MRKLPPCKDCERRFPGCHDKCGTFGEWKAQVAVENRKRDEVKELESLTISPRGQKAHFRKLKGGR